jgi:hypothetical protein
MNQLQNSEALRLDLFPFDSEEILRSTVRAARSRRRHRAMTHTAVVALFLASAALPLTHRAPSSAPTPVLVKAVLRTPLIYSKPFAARIISVPLAAAERTRTETAFPSITTATFHPTFIPISDDQLLSFFQGTAVALLRPGPHEAELLSW